MTSSTYNFEHVRILMIDDSAYFRDITRTILKWFGAKNVDEAENVADAIYMLDEKHYDIVFCDWHLDHESGIDFLRKVRQPQNAYATVPVIMVTAFADIHNVMKSRDAGANAFLAKPITPSSMAKILTSIIEAPRNFIKTQTYFGPDRRIKDMPHSGNNRRNGLEEQRHASQK